MARLPQALAKLKQEALSGSSGLDASFNRGQYAKTSDRREKSLMLLSQRFIQMFLISRSKVVALDDAARAFIGKHTKVPKHCCLLRLVC